MFGNHIGQNFSAYLHGELSPEEARRVAEHLRGCQRCQAEFDEVQFGARMAAHLVREQAPESLWDELELVIQREAPVCRQSAETSPKPPWLGMPALTFAAAALLLVGTVAFWFHRLGPRPVISNSPSWEVTRLDGRPTIGNRKMDEKGRLPVGEWLTTDNTSRAQISVGQIGEVKIEPDSRVRLVEAREDNHRLALTRGKMEAFIWAPPRKFFVDTPSAVAVDLGCSYTLEVNDDGQGLLHVTLGWVAFEWQGVESFVPAGAMCVTRPDFGPGTPYFSDASAEFQEALNLFDAPPPGIAGNVAPREIGLTRVLAAARQRDSLTLWHLLARAGGEQRGRVFDRLAALIPPPPTVTREGVLGSDRAMLDAWWDKLGLGDTEWWRMWKGPLPSSAK